ncbi:MAG: hypothetical protein PHS14_02610 [Elusimicrobia bacterium]|nr:hypothetical protein [Elusimicrobiota bacterium]
MRISSLLAALLLAAPASAQTRVAAPVAAPVTGIPLQIGAAPVPGLSMAPALSLSAPLSLSAAALAMPAPMIAPSAIQTVRPAAFAPLPVKVAALNAGISKAVASLADNPASGAAALTAGRDIEALLTGAGLSVPSAADETAAPAELAFALSASPSLAARADDLADSKGLKAGRMSGADFLSILEEARASAPAAPTPAADAAAREITAQVVRFARALIPADKPLADSVRRALAVWQVFDQEMSIAASKGTLEAIVADATLFASQVEASVEPVKTPKLNLTLAPQAPQVVIDSPKANQHPEDPNDYASVNVPGSIFGWKPIEQSPNHGLPPLDALIRRVLGDKKSAYAKGFELPGAARREDARVYFYGERHTDGELISANMKRLVEDARPGKPVIVLVEGYTGWSLRGWPAVKYLADRGLDPDALNAKGIMSGEVEVRGWDAAGNYDDSKHPLLQQHMDQLELNHLAHGETRGWRYYRDFTRAALTAWRSYRELWRAAIVVRNGDLNNAVAKAGADADASGATVHVIAGTDHLMQNPRLVGWPLIGRPSMRKTLRDALGGRPFWASQPPNTQD